MTYVITEPCIDVKDRACIEECPVDAIFEGQSMLYINPNVCVDDGACEAVCPVEAIFYEEDVPRDWTHFIAAAQDFASRVPDGPAGGVQYGFDSPLIFLPEVEPGVLASMAEARVAVTDATEASPFFQGEAGTRIALLWDEFPIGVDTIKALLLVFDKVALITHDAGVKADASGGGQWQPMVDMGLVARVPVADTVAAIDIESLRALYEVLLTKDIAARSTSRVPSWQKSAVYGAFRRLGVSIEMMARALPRDAATLEIASTVIRWMLSDSIAARGVSVHAIATERASVDAFTRVTAGLVQGARTVTLPCEWVLPSCGNASVEELMDFRASAGPSYREYMNRLTSTMTSLSRSLDATATTVSYSPDQVAYEASALRRLIRDLPWLGRGYVGFGLTGNAGVPPLRDSEDIAHAVNNRRATQGTEVLARSLFTVESAEASWI
jgi:ferredoxin